VHLHLPRFTLRAGGSLRTALQRRGVATMFGPHAQLDGLVHGGGAFVSDVLQKVCGRSRCRYSCAVLW
jgi:hypothetical protein